MPRRDKLTRNYPFTTKLHIADDIALDGLRVNNIRAHGAGAENSQAAAGNDKCPDLVSSHARR